MHADVHFQQREYDHDGGQDGQSDVMFNIDPDNHFHASIPTDTKYYNDEQFVRDVKSVSDLSFIHFNARSLNKNIQKIKDRGRVAYLDQRLNWTTAITGILKSVRPGRAHH